MRGLAGKRVVVTGGVSGIGAATVARFLEEGSEVVVFDQDAEGCKRIEGELPALKGAVACDVSDPEAVDAAFKKADELLGGLDVLINNAGISIRHNFLDITVEEWQQVVNVCLNGVFYVAQQAARRMQDSGGAILNTASTGGYAAYPYYADYCAAKAGVIELTRCMAIELAPKIRVVAICPGYTLTPMQKAEYTPEMLDEVNNKIPLKRHAEPAEMAGLFAYLASDEGRYFTGCPIVMDGGETAAGLAGR